MKNNILNIIGDPDCRSILKTTSRHWRTTSQIIRETRLPQTSTYRKILLLVRHNLLEVEIPENYLLRDKLFRAKTSKLRNSIIEWAYNL